MSEADSGGRGSGRGRGRGRPGPQAEPGTKPQPATRPEPQPPQPELETTPKATKAGRTGAALATFQRTPVVGRVVARLGRVNTMEAAARLAAQMFLAALPLLIVVAAFAPQSVKDLLVDAVRTLLGDKVPTDDIERALTANGELRGSIGVAGVIVMLISATALSRALQQVCERCWDLPKGSARLTAWRWLVWILGWLAALLFQTAIRQGFGGGTVVGVPASVVTSVALWWWTQHLLLGARIGWAPLLPGALLAGAAMTAFGYASPLVMPEALEQSQARYGPLGYVFTFLSWLIAGCCAVVVCVAVGQVVASSGPFPRWLGTPTPDQAADATTTEADR